MFQTTCIGLIHAYPIKVPSTWSLSKKWSLCQSCSMHQHLKVKKCLWHRTSVSRNPQICRGPDFAALDGLWTRSWPSGAVDRATNIFSPRGPQGQAASAGVFLVLEMKFQQLGELHDARLPFQNLTQQLSAKKLQKIIFLLKFGAVFCFWGSVCE